MGFIIRSIPQRGISLPVRASLPSKEEPCPLSTHKGYLIPYFPYLDFFNRIKIRIRLMAPKGVQPIPMYFRTLFSKINPSTIKTIPIIRNIMGCDTSPIFCSLFITFKVFLFLNIKKW
jgi:hypothetical protein